MWTPSSRPGARPRRTPVAALHFYALAWAVQIPRQRSPIMSSHAWSCFQCRRTVRGTPNVHLGEVEYCPECGIEMTYMGWAFRSPRRSDIDQWRKVELLRRAGYIFRGGQDWPDI